MFKPSAFLFLLFAGTLPVKAQTIEDSVTFKMFTIRGVSDQPVQRNSLNLSTLNTDSLFRNGALTLSEAMSQTPGVSMLSTGIGISKPVVRGLFGNRVLVLLNGLKFDNQQWQEEHGLGLSENGLSAIELIKGPMGVLYGSEAIGGVINLVDENRAAPQTSESDVAVRFNSNTLGGNINAGYKANLGRRWYRVRVSADNHADYSNGHQQRVLNSRYHGYTLKGAYGFQRRRSTTEFNLLSAYNQFGFIFNDIYTFVDEDARWNRQLNVNPNHMVILNIFSLGHNVQYNKNTRLNINAGIQSNRRMENEGGGAISLDMHLLTMQYLVRLEHRVNRNNSFVISHLNLLENNKNYGARKIVPNATMQEANVSAYWEYTPLKYLSLEAGAGVGEKQIRTTFTPSVNGQGKEIQPFKKSSPYTNFFLGMSFFKGKSFDAKLNLASGVRIPNLAELSSDGLHEGVFTYEIGNPNLKNEKNLSLNAQFGFRNKFLNLGFSPFYNHFNQYVWLAPTLEQWNGFPVFRYRQQDAEQYGLEATLEIKIERHLTLATAVSGMHSKTADGDFTPYTPANRLRSTLKYDFKLVDRRFNTFVTYESVAAQKELAINEMGSKAYQLLSAGISGQIGNGRHLLTWTLGGNNLSNTAYYDHLSRLKYFGLLNPGRNIFISLKYHCNSKL